MPELPVQRAAVDAHQRGDGAGNPPLYAIRGFHVTQEVRAHHGRERQREDRRNDDGVDDRQRELAQVAAHRAAHEH